MIFILGYSPYLVEYVMTPILASKSGNSQNISHFGHLLMSGLPTLFPHITCSHFSATQCGNYPTTPKTSPHMVYPTIIIIPTPFPAHSNFPTTPHSFPLQL